MGGEPAKRKKRKERTKEKRRKRKYSLLAVRVACSKYALGRCKAVLPYARKLRFLAVYTPRMSRSGFGPTGLTYTPGVV